MVFFNEAGPCREKLHILHIQRSAKHKSSEINKFSTKINLLLLNFLFEIFGNLVDKM